MKINPINDYSIFLCNYLPWHDISMMIRFWEQYMISFFEFFSFYERSTNKIKGISSIISKNNFIWFKLYKICIFRIRSCAAWCRIPRFPGILFFRQCPVFYKTSEKLVFGRDLCGVLPGDGGVPIASSRAVKASAELRCQNTVWSFFQIVVLTRNLNEEGSPHAKQR